jgi:hypothetical protein
VGAGQGIGIASVGRGTRQRRIEMRPRLDFRLPLGDAPKAALHRRAAALFRSFREAHRLPPHAHAILRRIGHGRNPGGLACRERVGCPA